MSYRNLRSNSAIRGETGEMLKGNWAEPVILGLIIMLINALVSWTGVGALLITGPIILGLSNFYLAFVKGGDTDIDLGLSGFRNFGSALGLFLLQGIFVFLGFLLFFIPGIVLSLAYSQAFFVLSENPDIGVMEALRESKEMMKGAKAKLFMMYIHFTFLAILCLFTFGIAYIWLIPWMNAVLANFYKELRNVPFS